MNILVSACLLGFDVKYDGTNNSRSLDERKLKLLMQNAHIIPVCPESLGGLCCPRSPCERVKNRVMNKNGEDKTAQFEKGAQQVLKAAEMFGCRYALLKENSPSCGYGRIYDGTFSHTTKEGSGVTAELLAENGIKIFGESGIDALLEEIKTVRC